MNKPATPIVRPNILILEGLWSDTRDAVNAAGGKATEVSPWNWVEVEEELLSGNFTGMILTGGSDVNPILYTDDAIHPQVYGVDALRDSVEWRALEIAEKQGIPVLGICRGSQIMTVFKDGTLVQHLGTHHRGGEHVVHAAAKGRTFRRAINAREMNVVSLHHQCVLDPGELLIAAYSHDGIPEAVESRDGKWLGCQFHPEIAAFDNSRAYSIFQWIVRASAAHAGGRAQSKPFRVASRERNAVQNWTGWDDQAWRDDVIEPGGRAYVTGTATEITTPQLALPAPKASPPRKPRRVGEASLPSMREATIRSGNELLICPLCGVIFDNERDRIDHAAYLHGYEVLPYMLDDYRVGAVIEPPEGDPAWEPHSEWDEDR